MKKLSLLLVGFILTLIISLAVYTVFALITIWMLERHMLVNHNVVFIIFAMGWVVHYGRNLYKHHRDRKEEKLLNDLSEVIHHKHL